MVYQIRIVPEVEAWLGRLREDDPDAARLVDGAMTALRLAGEGLGPPMVVPVDLFPRYAREDLDATYERQLEMLRFVRRATADVATSRKRMELQMRQLENNAAALGEQSERRVAMERQLATLRSQYAELRDDERHMSVAGQRLQARVDEFRTRKEVLQATWTAEAAAAEAARAEWDIDDALARLAEPSAPTPATAPPPDQAPAGRPGAAPVQLSELLPGAPDRTDIHILFTVEEPATAVVLAAGAGDDFRQAWYARAITDCGIRYRRDRSG
jgi:hypothetical protein